MYMSTEWVSVSVKLLIRVRDMLCSDLVGDTENPNCVFRFHQSLQANARIVPQLGYDCFFPSPFNVSFINLRAI
jgi:hypothetical protein